MPFLNQSLSPCHVTPLYNRLSDSVLWIWHVQQCQKQKCGAKKGIHRDSLHFWPKPFFGSHFWHKPWPFLTCDFSAATFQQLWNRAVSDVFPCFSSLESCFAPNQRNQRSTGGWNRYPKNTLVLPLKFTINFLETKQSSRLILHQLYHPSSIQIRILIFIRLSILHQTQLRVGHSSSSRMAATPSRPCLGSCGNRCGSPLCICLSVLPHNLMVD